MISYWTGPMSARQPLTVPAPVPVAAGVFNIQLYVLLIRKQTQTQRFLVSLKRHRFGRNQQSSFANFYSNA